MIISVDQRFEPHLVDGGLQIEVVSQSHHPAQFFVANPGLAPDSCPVAVEFAFADAIRFLDAVAHAIVLGCDPWILVLVAYETEDAEIAFCSLKRLWYS